MSIQMTKKGYNEKYVFYCGACRIVFWYSRSSFDREYYNGYVTVKHGNERFRWNFSDISPSPMRNEPKNVAESAMVFLTCGYNEEGEENIYPSEEIQEKFSMNMNHQENGEPKITVKKAW